MKNSEHFYFQKIIQSGVTPEPEVAARLGEHLQACAECREFAAFHSYLEQSLPRLAPALTPSAPALRKSTASIIYRFRSRNMMASTLQFSHKLGLAAALVVLVLGLSWTLKNLVPPADPGLVTAVTGSPVHTALPSATSSPNETPELPQPVLIAQLNRGEILRFALSPGGEWMAASTINQVCLFLTAGFEELWCSTSDPLAGSGASSLSFSPDGEYIAAGLNSGRILIFARESGERAAELADLRGSVRSLAWSPDSRWLAYGSDSKFVHVWNPKTGESLPRLAADDSAGMALAWSPDGTRLAAATYIGSIFIWETQGFEVTFSHTAETPLPFSAIAWAPDGKTLYTTSFAPYGCGEGCNPAYVGWVQAWDASSGDQLFKVEVDDPLASLAVSPAGQWLAVGGEVHGRLIVMDARTGEQAAERSSTQAWAGMGWSTSDRLVYLSAPTPAGKTLASWNPVTGELDEQLLPGFSSIYSMSWLPEGNRLLTIAAGGQAVIWQAQTGQPIEDISEMFTVSLQGRSVSTLISPDGQYLAAFAQGLVTIHPLNNGQLEQPVNAAGVSDSAFPYRLRWSKAGSRLAAVVYVQGEETLMAWDARSGEQLISIPAGAGAEFMDLDWSPDGSQLLYGWNDTEKQQSRLTFWDVQSGSEAASYAFRPISQLFWLEADRVLVFFENQAEIIHPLTQERLASFALEADRINLTPDGRLIVGYSGSQWWIRSLANPQVPLVTLGNHDGPVWELSLSPSNQYIAIQIEGEIVSIWDVAGLFNP